MRMNANTCTDWFELQYTILLCLLSVVSLKSYPQLALDHSVSFFENPVTHILCYSFEPLVPYVSQVQLCLILCYSFEPFSREQIAKVLPCPPLSYRVDNP